MKIKEYYGLDKVTHCYISYKFIFLSEIIMKLYNNKKINNNNKLIYEIMQKY
jgi:hypothetical protein